MEELTGLVEQGMDGFIFSTDVGDVAGQITRFVGEVVPRVRELTGSP